MATTSVNICDLGAVPDDPSHAEANSRAIQLAVDMLSSSGGGTVIMPSGLWAYHLARPAEVRGDNIEFVGGE